MLYGYKEAVKTSVISTGVSKLLPQIALRLLEVAELLRCAGEKYGLEITAADCSTATEWENFHDSEITTL